MSDSKKDDPIWNEFFPMTDDDNHRHLQDDDTIQHGSDPTSQPATDSLQPIIAEHPLSDVIVETLKTIYDPELPVNIYDLGLIYRVDIDQNNHIDLIMTLTTPGCPVAQTFPGMIQHTLEMVDGVTSVYVEIVWDPPWSQDRMSDEAKLLLGLL